jgi:hypothetical protein
MIVTALKKQKVNQDIQIRKILITLFFFVLAGLCEIGICCDGIALGFDF